jgi:hypothetical protein
VPHSSDYDRLMVEPEDKGEVIRLKEERIRRTRKDSEDRGGGKKWVPSRSHSHSHLLLSAIILFKSFTNLLILRTGATYSG